MSSKILVHTGSMYGVWNMSNGEVIESRTTATLNPSLDRTGTYSSNADRFRNISNVGKTLYAHCLDSNAGKVYAVTSEDEGASWTRIRESQSYMASGSYEFIEGVKVGATTYLVDCYSPTSGVFHFSSDNGANWTTVNNLKNASVGGQYFEVYGVKLTSRYVYIYSDSSIIRYNIADINQAPTVISRSLLGSNEYWSGMFFGSRHGSIQVTDGGGDDGKDLICAITEKYFNINTYDASAPAGWYGGAAISRDGGESFQVKYPPRSFFVTSGQYSNATQAKDISSLLVYGETLLIGGRGKLAYSKDLGQTWEVFTQGSSTHRLLHIRG